MNATLKKIGFWFRGCNFKSRQHGLNQQVRLEQGGAPPAIFDWDSSQEVPDFGSVCGPGARSIREAGIFLGRMLPRHRLWLSAPVVEAIGQHIEPRRPRKEVAAALRAIRSFHGLEQLPTAWQVGLLSFLRKRPGVVPAVAGFNVVGSMLLLDLFSGQSVVDRSAFLLHRDLNMFLYPSLWRTATPRHLHLLWATRPDLHAELARLPQWARRATDSEVL